MQIKTPSPFPSKTANKFFRTPSNPIFLLTIIPLSHHPPSSLARCVCRVSLLGKEFQQYMRLTGIPLQSQICNHLNYSFCARLKVIPWNALTLELKVFSPCGGRLSLHSSLYEISCEILCGTRLEQFEAGPREQMKPVVRVWYLDTLTDRPHKTNNLKQRNPLESNLEELFNSITSWGGHLQILAPNPKEFFLWAGLCAYFWNQNTGC